MRVGVGHARTCIPVAGLVDTNILVYRYDKRYPLEQAIAVELLRRGIADRSLAVPRQAEVEFVSAVTRVNGKNRRCLPWMRRTGRRGYLLDEFPVIYSTEDTVRTALRGAALYKLSWYDAHLWAYADERGLDPIWSEAFEDGRLYGRVRVCNPFRASVHEAPPSPYQR